MLLHLYYYWFLGHRAAAIHLKAIYLQNRHHLSDLEDVEFENLTLDQQIQRALCLCFLFDSSEKVPQEVHGTDSSAEFIFNDEEQDQL